MWQSSLFGKRTSGPRSRRAGRAPRPGARFRPGVEALEGRLTPSAFAVTTTDDGGPGSLRQAILDANAHPGADTIDLPAGDYRLTQGELAITDDLTISST